MAAQAAKEKEKGNEAFKAGDYPTAIGHYTAAILADGSDATFPLNRAAAYLKLGKHEDAERDCSTVLRLSKGNVKALFRRAQARVELGKIIGAHEDLQQAATLEPANQSVKQELEKVAQMVANSTPAKKVVPKDVPSAPPKRRRVPITIVDANGKRELVVPEEQVAPAPTTPQPKPKSALKQTPTPAAATKSAPASSPIPKDDLMKPVSSRPLAPNGTSSSSSSAPKSTPAPAPAAKPTPPPASFKEAKTARDTSKPSLVGGGIFRASGENTIFASKPSGSGSGSKVAENAAPASATTKTPASVPTMPNSEPPPKAPETLLQAQYEGKTPTTLFEFTRAWEVTQDVGVRRSLLSHIPPTSFPTLFQTSLEPALFVEIVDALSSSAAGLDSKAYLTAFAAVPRFGTVVRFLTAQERKRVREAWASVGVGVGVEGGGAKLERPDELDEVWGAVYR
ncbi:hypothetical protein HMN09_00895300 [Mycena chlorophos]|uniref:RNA polymerase II-associated protein 3 n=1 Tax=Mycena chlorophos TaxID=658473 RepID=A0A8H6SMZ2_MYCCL|nr:hypothetical protein HMN09_00895300 [Mycena chlorophos]